MITEEGNTFYHRLSTELMSKLEHHSNLTITISSHIHNGNVINDIISAADVRVIFPSMSSHLSSRILCKAYSRAFSTIANKGMLGFCIDFSLKFLSLI